MNLSTKISLPNETAQIPPWFYPGLLPVETPPPPRRPQPLRPSEGKNSRQTGRLSDRSSESFSPQQAEKFGLPSAGGFLLPSADSFSRDSRYLESMYPDLLKRLRFAVREEIEAFSGKNSFLYDEYPDKLSLRRLAKQAANAQSGLADEFLEKGCPKEWFEAFVELLLFQQLLETRRERRRLFPH